MSIFGDQAWKKIQRFLVMKESSGNGSDADGMCITYRSVKGIQSKIYQIKPEVERDADLVREIRKLVTSEGFTANPVKPQPMLVENLSPKPHSVSSFHDE